MHEFETTLNVPLKIRVRFDAEKPDSAVGYPGGIVDLEFKIVTKEAVKPLVLRINGNGYVTRDTEHPVSDGLHDTIFDAADWDELCMAHLRDEEYERKKYGGVQKWSTVKNAI